MSHRTARPFVALLLAGAAAACGGGEKKVVDNYFNAVRAKDNQTLSSFAAVEFNEPVQSWKVQGARDEATVPATLPQLSNRLKELEAEAAAAKKTWDAFKLNNYGDLTKVDEIKRKGGTVPAGLSAAAGEWDKYNEKSRELKKQIAAAKAEMEKEKRAARLSVGALDDLDSLQGEVHTKQVDVEVTSNGQTKPYVMTLRKYELKREAGGPRPISRWVVQDLKPKS
jgi:hypothetical protein